MKYRYLKILLIFFLLLFTLESINAQDSKRSLTIFLLDKGELVKRDNNNYTIRCSKCDSANIYGYKVYCSPLYQVKRYGKLGGKNYDKDEFYIDLPERNRLLRNYYPKIHIRIVKNDNLVMNIFLKYNFIADSLNIQKIINFKQGTFILPDITEDTYLNNFIIPLSDTVNSTLIYNELIVQANKYFLNNKYINAQHIYQLLLDNYEYDEYIIQQIKKCNVENRKIVEEIYIKQIELADTSFNRKQYRSARQEYVYARTLSYTHDNYIQRKIKQIDTIGVNINVYKFNRANNKKKEVKNADVVINGQIIKYNNQKSTYYYKDTTAAEKLLVSISYKTLHLEKLIERNRVRIPIKEDFIFKYIKGLYIPESVDNLKNAISLGGVKSGIALGTPYAYSGLRLNLFDKKMVKRFNGISFSLKNQIYRHVGLQLGIYNQSLFPYNIMDGGRSYRGTVIGSQFGLLNTTNELYGFQFGLYNIANQGFGMQCGVVNAAKNNAGFKGLKLGAVNYKGTNRGLLLGLYNQSGNLGLQIGLANKTDLSRGVEIGIFNYMKHEDGTFILKNEKRYKQTGWAIGLLNINKETYGVQIGAVNIKTGRHNKNLGWSSADKFSLQFGIINRTETLGKTKLISEKSEGKYIYTEEPKIVTGFQLGAINRAQRNNGIQIGVLNSTDNGLGIQFGILNFRKNNKWFAKVLPIINFKIEKKKEVQK